jgi:hypothetical protein
MAIEIDIRIIGETTAAVVQELGAFAAHLSSGLGVGAQAINTPDTPGINEAQARAVADSNGAGKPASTRKRSTAGKPEAETTTTAAKAQLDRAAIIDGLTKIYSKGDEDVRLAITKFRDGQGADRLRDLKDDALPAAAELLVELKLVADQPQV